MGHNNTCQSEHGHCGHQHNKGSSADWAPDCDMTAGLLYSADKAWESLMMDKMKAQWEATRGKNMDKMAKAAVETATAYWESKMKDKSLQHEHMDKMKQSGPD